MVEIINYEERYHADFKRLNLEWLEKYALIEQYDIDILDNPRGKIIDGGGCIFLAKLGDEIVGTAALALMEEGEYELVKMSVNPAQRGAGIGKLLMEHCLEQAKELKAQKIILYSNSKLQTALKMYEKYGFAHVPVVDSPFVTADVKMELSL